jgi:cell division GTPase FtsZ
VNILLLSAGGGGGNILRSVKALFDRDVAVTEKTDPAYAERLRDAIATRFLDTNEFSLSDIPEQERVLIGARTTRRLGARHDPKVARQALEESSSEVEALVSRYSVVIVIGTGGKGTGAGTMFPLAEIARRQRKLVLPIFVLPSFERHEVDKRRYDHALTVAQQFDAARIRLVEILNDRGYDDADPQPQSMVWERMNLPIARALRGLMYVLWDLSQVDPSDLSALFAGNGRFRIGFGELDPQTGPEPSDAQVQQTVRDCWGNAYYAFTRPAGTSLICIHGDWSNVVDSRIKGGLAASATAGAAASPYSPLYTRVAHSPKPWGVTGLFAEFTGVHAPVDVEWPLERDAVDAAYRVLVDDDRLKARRTEAITDASFEVEKPQAAPPVDEKTRPSRPPFATLWELAVAVNRSDPAALAVAGNGANAAITVEGAEVKKLLRTVWFRTVAPQLSEDWKARILDAFVGDVLLPDHIVKVGRQPMQLSELTYAQLREVAARFSIPDTIRPDLDLLITIGRLWGGDAVERVRFSDALPKPSRLAGLLQGLRS